MATFFSRHHIAYCDATAGIAQVPPSEPHRLRVSVPAQVLGSLVRDGKGITPEP